MATLNVTLVPVTMTEHGMPVVEARHKASEKVTTSSSSAPSTITAPTLVNGRQMAWEMTMKGGDAWVVFGVGAQTAVAGVGHFLRENVKEDFRASSLETFAVIDDA